MSSQPGPQKAKTRTELTCKCGHKGEQVNLAGLGKLVEQIRIFATDVMDRYLHRVDRRLKRDETKQAILAKK
jgi:hypothetical protein